MQAIIKCNSEKGKFMKIKKNGKFFSRLIIDILIVFVVILGLKYMVYPAVETSIVKMFKIDKK